VRLEAGGVFLRNLEAPLASADWYPAADIERGFVLNMNPEPSPAFIWRTAPQDCHPLLSVIIPTLDANRNDYFFQLLRQIQRQSLKVFELIVIRGDPRQGRAINIGAELSKGIYILILDDDTSLPDPETFKKLVSVMEKHPEIGIAGGNNVVPKYASSFVRRVMKEIPRRSWKPVQLITDSDLAEHPCMIMRTDEFKSVGGENELIPRGLDPYLREAFRRAGKQVVVVPSVIYHHLPPNSLAKLLHQFYRNGIQAAYTNRYFPQWVIETPSEHGSFQPYTPLPKRILHFPIRLFKALIKGKPLWFLCEVAYAFGFLHDLLLSKKSKELFV